MTVCDRSVYIITDASHGDAPTTNPLLTHGAPAPRPSGQPRGRVDRARSSSPIVGPLCVVPLRPPDRGGWIRVTLRLGACGVARRHVLAPHFALDGESLRSERRVPP
jgi:hypothetical protein